MSHLDKIYNQRMLQIFDEYKMEGITNEVLSKKIGIPQQISGMVRGGNRGFSLEQIIKMCKFTKISSDWILGLSKKR